MEIFKTKKENVNIIMEYVEGSYVVYIENYDMRINLNVSNEDEDLTRKFCFFLSESYNEGLADGKNSVFIDAIFDEEETKNNINITSREVTEFPTKNNNVFICLEKYEDNDYSIYISSFDKRIEFIIYNQDIKLMTDFSDSLVKTYDSGYTNGRNEALHFINNF